MAEGKKSFIAYCDWLESFEELSDEEAGRLVKHLFRYVNDLNPEAPDKLTKMCFIPIKQFLKRDLGKYEQIVERNRENGKKGGRPKKRKKPKKPSGLLENPSEPKKADNDNDNDNDNNSIDKSILLDVNLEDVPEKHQMYFKIAKGLLNFFISHREYRELKVNKYLLEAKYSSYVTPIRLLVESDGYDIEDVKETARYLMSEKVDDHFFKDVVLSTEKFRKQFENIKIKRMKYLKKLELKKQQDKKGMI